MTNNLLHMGDWSGVFDLATYSLNTKSLIYMFYMCLFEVQTWKMNNQIILLGYHNIL